MTEPMTPRRGWREKFGEAFSGIRRAVRTESSFRVHLPVAALVVALAAALGCTPIEWCLLIGCVGLVLTAELFNTSMETLFKALDEHQKARIEGCLDIAAGAVLMASLTAVAVGTVVFGSRVLEILDGA